MNQPPLIAETTPQTFQEFWNAYPKKVAKFAAKRAFQSAIRITSIEAMLTAITEQAKSDQWQRGFIPHPATWLRGQRWNDEMETVKPQAPSGVQLMNYRDELNRVINKRKAIRDSYSENMGKTKEDIQKLKDLSQREKELLVLLNLKY